MNQLKLKKPDGNYNISKVPLHAQYFDEERRLPQFLSITYEEDCASYVHSNSVRFDRVISCSTD